ncbi:MAG: hypothetical protein QOE14_2083 [Humisphaera sp.]|nr:hypothetical protein [Humisphaera sp.]
MCVNGCAVGRAKSKSFLKKWTAAAALALGGVPTFALAASPAPVQEVSTQAFDWFVNTTPGYLQSPFLTNETAPAVNAFLKSLPANQPKAIKIEVPISNATANLIFNNPSYNVSYILGDVEAGGSTEIKMRDIARQVRFVNGQNNGAKTRSYNAFIGNFGFTKIDDDKTFPAGYKNDKKGQHSFAGYNIGGYNTAKLNMSMPELYSGSGSYRTPAAGNSTAPNIRSAMFTLPILRVSQNEVNTTSKERNVPWVARFNNFGNTALDTDRNSSNGYRFVTGQPMPAGYGFPAVSASKTANQLLSRRDFATLVSHYRMRGADSFVLFEPGVEGYTNEQKRNDAKAGWTQPNINNVFGASDYKLVLGKEGGKNDKDILSSFTVDGKTKTAEQTGSIFSGVYSLSLKTLDIVLSNMDEVDHTLTLPKKIAGYDLKTNSFTLDGGSHLLVEYKLTTSGVNKGWSVALQTVPFQAIENSRHGFGIPEPSTMTMAAITGLLLIGRRRRSGMKQA